MKIMLAKLRRNHLFMMVLCCGIPLVLLLLAVYFFGLSKSYLFWFILLLCPLTHYFMMKDMHKDHKKQEENGIHTNTEKKYKGFGLFALATILFMVMLILMHPSWFQ